MPCTDDWLPTKSIGYRNLLYFGCPYSSPVYSIEIKKPMWGDIRKLNYHLIIHQNSSGIIRVMHPTYILASYTWAMTFETLTKTVRDAFDTFLRVTHGGDMKFIDHENRTWRGVITTPLPGFIQRGTNDYGIQIEFWGILVGGAPS